MEIIDVKKSFGESVKSRRALLGLSQEKLAERANLHRTYISDVERGSRNVSLENIERLARALEISMPALFPKHQPAGEKVVPGKDGGGYWNLVDVLLVEDNPVDVELTLGAFKKSRLANSVQVVGDGEAALDYLFCRGRFADLKTENRPQVVLLDLNLPKLSGLEVLRQVRADKKTRSLSVVVLTVSQRSADVDECLRLGADAYIVKPVDLHNLCRTTPLLKLDWALIKATPAPRLELRA